MLRSGISVNRRLCAFTKNLVSPQKSGIDSSEWNRRSFWSCPQNVSHTTHRLSAGILHQQYRGKKDEANLSALFKPVPVKSNPDDISVGAELTGKLDKGELLKVLNRFTQKRETKMLCMENGLDSK